jgi:hypothetical protein
MSPPASSVERAGRSSGSGAWRERSGEAGGLNWGISGQRLLDSPASPAALGGLNIIKSCDAFF